MASLPIAWSPMAKIITVAEEPFPVARGPGWELRCGDAFDVLADVESVDALISDPPYSERTHSGHDGAAADVGDRQVLNYAAWNSAHVAAFCDDWSERCRGWFAVMSDSVLSSSWRRHFEDRGRLGFAPVPCVIPGMTVRLMGDGPSSWCIWLNVARPRKAEWCK